MRGNIIWKYSDEYQADKGLFAKAVCVTVLQVDNFFVQAGSPYFGVEVGQR